MHKTFLMSFSDKRDDIGTSVQTDIHLPPLDKRYSPIISSICGPNKYKRRYDGNRLGGEVTLVRGIFGALYSGP